MHDNLFETTIFGSLQAPARPGQDEDHYVLRMAPGAMFDTFAGFFGPRRKSFRNEYCVACLILRDARAEVCLTLL